MPTTHRDFGSRTGALDVAKVFKEEIGGSVVIITGVSPNSIGAALALAIASQSPKLLILASRTLSNIQKVTQDIHASYPNIEIEAVVIDLSNLQSIRQAAEKIKRILGPGGTIDVLFNNAGINVSQKSLTAQGIELQFATNHLGPFLFTALLLPLLLSSKTGKGRTRIINTASEAHIISPVRFSDINQDPGKIVDENERPRKSLPKGMLKGDGTYDGALAYAQSKTANVLFSVGLNKRGVRSFAVSPGNIMTNLVRELDKQAVNGLLQGIGNNWKTLDQGASTLVVAGFDPGLDDEMGVYVEDCQMKKAARWATDKGKADRLWGLSEELVGESFGEKKGSHL